MTRLSALLGFLFWSQTLSAQDCTNPIPNTTFQAGFNQIAAQTTNQKKLDASLEFIKKGCFTSAQIKSLAVLFTEDSYRLEFGKAAYSTTIDRVNFFDVYDAFTTFSSALRLYDFTRSNNRALVSRELIGTRDGRDSEPARVLPSPVRFADIIYPTTTKYNGNRGCEGPEITEATFMTIAQQVNSQPTDESKMIAIETATTDHCMSMAQLMKVSSLLQSEKLRLRALTNGFNHVLDQDHYPAAKALFSTTELRQQWEQSAQFALTPAPPPCESSDDEVKQVTKTIQTKNFPDDKLALLNVIAKDKCFSTRQVLTISKEFTFEKDKVSAMKMLYPGCTDKNNYYSLVNELTFGYLQDELTAFIKNEGK